MGSARMTDQEARALLDVACHGYGVDGRDRARQAVLEHVLEQGARAEVWLALHGCDVDAWLRAAPY